ncbi:deoxycytidylate deaminase-related protein [hydrothermal vent metagenome]|uniref:Deoxycytidylate deaminase-related protein n=1 Tax=hydrothermal vent metagenome TaxID=652676 RepID=A0A3B0WVF7_9ZZZZ
MSAEKKSSSNVSRFPNATDIIKAVQSRELFFAVVGHVGSGISEVAGILKSELESQGYDVEIIKASSAIKDWSLANEHHVPDESGRASIDNTCTYQNSGDLMREHTQDYSAVVQGMMKNVRMLRAEKTGAELKEGMPIEPDNNKRAYIFDSIRHPAEVYLLRTVYSDSFSLIGVVCQEDIRTERLLDKFYEHKDRSKENSKIKVNKLMERDADDKKKDHGQHVADAFFESDYFVDNTVNSVKNKENWQMHEMMGRLIDIMTHARIVRPTVPEKAMHFAMTAQISSSCLSRQVGAAIVDESGDIVATGTNEVPKAGGGVYGKRVFYRG